MSTLSQKTIELITELEDELMHLSIEWDRLDSQGNQTDKQGKLKRQMLVIEKEIDGLNKMLKVIKDEQ